MDRKRFAGRTQLAAPRRPWGWLAAALMLVAAAAGAQGVTVDAASPASAEQGTVNLDVTINGSGFERPAQAFFYRSGTEDPAGIRVNSTTYRNSTRLIANIDVAPDTAVALFDVRVVLLRDGRHGTGVERFRVNARPVDTYRMVAIERRPECLASIISGVDSVTPGSGSGGPVRVGGSCGAPGQRYNLTTGSCEQVTLGYALYADVSAPSGDYATVTPQLMMGPDPAIPWDDTLVPPEHRCGQTYDPCGRGGRPTVMTEGGHAGGVSGVMGLHYGNGFYTCGYYPAVWLWRGDHYDRLLLSLGGLGEAGWVDGMRSDGVVVGYIGTYGGSQHAVSWLVDYAAGTASAPTVLPPGLPAEGMAYAINDTLGDVAGWARRSDGAALAALWPVGAPGPRLLDPLEVNASGVPVGGNSGSGVTASASVGGWSSITTGKGPNRKVIQRATLWPAPGYVPRNLGGLAAAESANANDIREAAGAFELVGNSTVQGGGEGTRWRVAADGSLSMRNLNNLIPATSHCHLMAADEVNDQGVIVGDGTCTVNGQTMSLGLVLFPTQAWP